MIKATIQNGSLRTKIRFPCSEKELSEKLGEFGVNPEHLSPVGTIVDIEPAELSVLKGCEVSLDALNYLGKRLDGISGIVQKQFLAVLSCDELEMRDLRKIINLTFNLPRFTLIEDADDLERAGLTHILNIRGGVPTSDLEDREWLAEEGRKLINSDKGFDTKYGKLFVNEEVPFEELFNGTTFPEYYYNSDTKAAVEICCNGLTELVELPCEDITIKKAIYRLGADTVRNCTFEIDSMLDLSDEWQEKFREIERTKEIYSLNNLLKTEDIRLQEVQSSISNKEEMQKNRRNKMKLNFRNSYHRKTFTGFISENVRNPYYSRSEYIAAVFLLSADKFLWTRSQSVLTGHSVVFENIELTGISTDGYALFKAAKSVYNGSADISLNELCDIDLIGESTFQTIFSGALLLRNGIGLLNWRT